jgi:peptidoglycan-associated lipoprotein
MNPSGLRLAHLSRHRPTQALLQVLLLAGAVATGAAGCGDDPPPKVPEPVATDTGPKPKRNDTKSPTSGSVQIDDKIIKLCGDLPTARFAFDSADVQPDAAAALDALARCFVSGPGKGKGLRLIGHADSRGETEYNLALGQKRAGSIAEFLAKKGMEQGKLATSSKGEFEASGTDEDGWARDRKVEVILAD